MVEPVIVRKGRNDTTKQPPLFIVELVGLAGAGKTTLLRVLCERDEKIRIGAEIELRKVQQLPIFLGQSPFLLPFLVNRCRQSRGFTWDEIKTMVYLKAWPRVLRKQALNGGPIILLDHGPVFKLATLNAFGPENLKSPMFESWWQSVCKQWAFTLDMVIWLDAPEVVLVERINSRNQRHTIKGESDLEAHRFLTRYRASYEKILAKLTAYRGLPLLQFDTQQASIEQIADEVLFTFGTKLSGF